MLNMCKWMWGSPIGRGWPPAVTSPEKTYPFSLSNHQLPMALLLEERPRGLLLSPCWTSDGLDLVQVLYRLCVTHASATSCPEDGISQLSLPLLTFTSFLPTLLVFSGAEKVDTDASTAEHMAQLSSECDLYDISPFKKVSLGI